MPSAILLLSAIKRLLGYYQKNVANVSLTFSAYNKLNAALAEAGIEAEVSGRVKHIYSIYRKMKLKGLSFDQLYDIRALRVLVTNPSDCYHVLGLVHGLWRYIPEQFDDYITNPKSNGYRSLHTAVIAENKSLEVQIRTHEMHFEAELGMCAHVNYKEGLKNKKDNYLNQRISSLRQLLSINNETRNQPRSALLTGEELEEIEFDEEEQLVDLTSSSVFISLVVMVILLSCQKARRYWILPIMYIRKLVTVPKRRASISVMCH